MFTTAEYTARLIKLRGILREKNIQLAILNRNTDLYYFSGSVQPSYLFIPAEGAPFVLARKALSRIREEACHLQLEAFSGTPDIKKIIAAHGLSGLQRIGYTLDATTYATTARWQQIFAGTETFDLSPDIRLLRAAKSAAEIALMEKAGRIMAEMPKLIQTHFHPGMTELELSAALEYYFRLNGHGGIVRCHSEEVEMNFGSGSGGINQQSGVKCDGFCSGIKTAVRYETDNRPIAKGEPLILDYAFNLEGYHIDQVRMFSWGQPAEPVRRAYQAMRRVMEAMLEALRPGKSWSAVYEDAVWLAGELGYGAEFMGRGPDRARFVGHGVGLELDEPPFIAPQMEEMALTAGMTVAVEPMVALAEAGVIGIEDTVVLEAGKARVLTTCDPEFIIVE